MKPCWVILFPGTLALKYMLKICNRILKISKQRPGSVHVCAWQPWQRPHRVLGAAAHPGAAFGAFASRGIFAEPIHVPGFGGGDSWDETHAHGPAHPQPLCVLSTARWAGPAALFVGQVYQSTFDFSCFLYFFSSFVFFFFDFWYFRVRTGLLGRSTFLSQWASVLEIPSRASSR